MKKFLLILTAVFAVSAKDAEAQSYRYQSYEPYSYYGGLEKRQERDNMLHNGLSVGLDLQGSFIDMDRENFSSDYPTLSGHIMYRSKNYWAVEVGMWRTGESSSSRFLGAPINQTIESTSQISAMYADLIGFVPIFDYVDGFLSIGYEQVKATYTQTLSDDVEETGGGLRVGLGMEVFYKSGFSLRGFMRYHTVSLEDSFNGFFSVGLGGRYTF